MLLLTRKVNEVIVIGDDEVRVTVVALKRGAVQLGFQAPKGIAIHRKEVFDSIKQQEGQPRAGDGC